MKGYNHFLLGLHKGRYDIIRINGQLMKLFCANVWSSLIWIEWKMFPCTIHWETWWPFVGTVCGKIVEALRGCLAGGNVNGEVNTLALLSDFSVYFLCKDEMWSAILTPSATMMPLLWCHCILLGTVSLNKPFLSKADFCSHILTQQWKGHYYQRQVWYNF